MRIAVMIAVAASVASHATAQTVPAFVECAWTDDQSGEAFTSTYRITTESWASWNSKSWQFEPFSCGKFSSSVDTKCAATVTDNEYDWHEYGVRTVPAYTNRAEQKLTIDRQTGKASFLAESAIKGFDGTLTVFNDVHQTGTCKRVDDPSLKPKPQPKL